MCGKFFGWAKGWAHQPKPPSKQGKLVVTHESLSKGCVLIPRNLTSAALDHGVRGGKGSTPGGGIRPKERDFFLWLAQTMTPQLPTHGLQICPVWGL